MNHRFGVRLLTASFAACALALLLGSPADAQLVINEVLASNQMTNVDDDRDASDWAELVNAGGTPIDLTGYTLSDDIDVPRKWSLPALTLAPGEHLLIWCSGKSRVTGLEPEAPAQLAAHWPLDEGSGAVFGNSADDAFDGYLTDEATIEWAPVQPDTDGNRPDQAMAVRFTGSGSWIQTDFPGIGGNSPRTVACWIRTDQPGGNDILGWGRPTNGLKWHFRVNTVESNGLVGAIRTEYQGGQNIGTTRVDDGRWHHVAAVFARGANNGQEIDHYVDGVLQGKTGGDRSIITDTADPLYRVTIGLTRQGTNTRRWFNGQIADVRIYDDGVGRDGVLAIMAGDEPPPLVVPLNLHSNFEISSAGEQLLLVNPSGTIVDLVRLPEQHPDISYGRSPDGSGDFLYHVEPTPGAANTGAASSEPLIVADTKFVPDRGFFDAPISVEITTATAGATIKYTVDGSTPSRDHGRVYSGPIAVSDTTAVRAMAFLDGSKSTNVDTHTYIYLETPSGGGVLNQPSRPPGFPPNWGPNGGVTDYAMDLRIATDTGSPLYDARVSDGLLDFPSISLVMPVDDFFSTATGLQANPLQRGIEWERACSVEFIYPDDPEAGAQVNAGIRIQGNASRSPTRPKHNMRLLFKKIYGAGKLRHDLFDDTSVDEFDTLILRGGNGDSWFHPSATQQRRAQYIRDQWHRDVQLGMGHLSAHQRYMNLYINGLYWGLYHVFERPTGSFLASHLGGQREDWDAINSLDPLDGDLQAWNEMMAIADASSIGTPAGWTAIQDYLDVTNLVDYLLINFYSGNVDWDVKNWYAGRRREQGAGYMFFSWDAERTFWETPTDRTGLNNNNRPSHLHQRLTSNPEYRMLFADRVRRHLFGDGLLTRDEAERIWMARVDEVETGLVAESARFGDNKRATPYTVDAEWRDEIERLTGSFMGQRTDLLIDQIRARGLYPNVAAPEFSNRGGRIEASVALTITAPAGQIYYTLDDSDPRLPGGAVSPRAVAANSGVRITIQRTTRLRARVRSGSTWSAQTEATFIRSALRITEIMYHPLPPPIESPFEQDEFEFLELTNTGTTSIDLEGVRLTEGVRFDFSDGLVSELAPGEIVVVVENLQAFASRHDTADLLVAGSYAGKLANDGERIRLVGALGETLHDFTYDDAWHPSTDGGGPSLVVDEPSGDPAGWGEATTWRPSRFALGSPGIDETDIPSGTDQVPGDANQDGIVDISDAVRLFIVLFRGGVELPCSGDLASGGNTALLDVNGDAGVDVSDGIALLSYLLLDGPEHVLGDRCMPIQGCGSACAGG